MAKKYWTAVILDWAAVVVKRGWTRGAQARDINDQPVDPRDPRAVSFSAIGALIRAQHMLNAPRGALEEAERHFRDTFAHEPYFRHAEGFNDESQSMYRVLRFLAMARRYA